MAENNSSAPLKTAQGAAMLWCVHVTGADDVHPMPSREVALEEANALNTSICRMKRQDIDPVLIAVVAEWPHSADSHAAGLMIRDECLRMRATPALPATEDSSAGDLAEGQPEPVFGDEEHVSVPRGLLSAACSAIDKKRDGVKVLAELRRYTFGDLAAPQAQPADARIAYLQESDQHLLHRFIETTEDDESFDIGKDAVKRLANLGVVESYGFGRYGVTMFGYWVHEHYWHQNPSLPLKTNADRDREHRAAMAAAQEGGKA